MRFFQVDNTSSHVTRCCWEHEKNLIISQYHHFVMSKDSGLSSKHLLDMVFVPKCIRFPNGQLLLGLAKNYEKGKCPFVFNYYNLHLQPIKIILHSKCNKNSLDSRCSKVKIQAQNYKKIKPQWHLYCELFAKTERKIVESK